MRRLCLLLILPVVLAVTPANVTITVMLDRDGTALVREEYDLYLDANGLKVINGLEKNFGNSFTAWVSSGAVEGFGYHVGQEITDLKNITMVVRKIGANLVRLTVNYTVPNAAILEQDLPNKSVWLFNNFRFPVVEGAIKVPEGYSVSVILPPTAEIIKIEPEADVEGRVATWNGPFSTNVLYIKYSTMKPFVFPGLIDIIIGISPSTYFSMLFAAIAVILIWKREKIKQGIKKYVEDYSRLEE